MFNKQGQEENFKEIETIIGPSVKIKGDFHSTNNVIVEGIVEGSLKTSGNLKISDKAKITANIEAKEAIISGDIKGNIKIHGYLEITSSAKIFGDISAINISIERGAIINGQCSITNNGEETKKPQK